MPKAKNTSAVTPMERERGKNETVSLTVRIPREEWKRLHMLAISEGVSIQTLAVRGFNHVFAEMGQRSIKI
jgi:hypothetical protein